MVKIQKKSKAPTVTSLTALMDGLNFNAEPEQPKKKPPKKDSTYSLSRNMKNLNLTGKKQPRSSRSKTSGIRISKMDISNTGIKKKKGRLQHRVQRITRQTEKTLSSLFSDKLGVGTKKKRKKRRSKSKKKKRRKRRSKTKRN